MLHKDRIIKTIKLVTVLVLILLIKSCNQPEKRLARSSAEIDTVKELIQNFQNRDWNQWSSHYKSGAKLYHNNWNEGATVVETRESLSKLFPKENKYVFKKPLIFENARDDAGNINGVHFWGVISNGDSDLPMHLSFHFKKGKISEEYGFYNLSNLENKNSLKHNIGEFGDSMETIRKNLEGRYRKLEERELQIILSTAKNKQTQLECYDFVYRGKKRFVELMFSDNKLEVIHIMKTETDHDELKNILVDKFGKPSYSSSVVDYYAAQGISLRSKPYEISFHSDKIKVEYDGYMKSLK